MYRDEILDLYKNPRNEGKLETKYRAEGENTSCGDHTEISLKIENNKVKNIKHVTDGCAISTAANSVLTEELKGMKTEKVKQLDKNWITNKLGIELSPMRLKCATLGLKTTQKALEKDS